MVALNHRENFGQSLNVILRENQLANDDEKDGCKAGHGDLIKFIHVIEPFLSLLSYSISTLVYGHYSTKTHYLRGSFLSLVGR